MGRYAEPLAEVFVVFAGVGAGDKVLDVGCGPGALLAELCAHYGVIGHGLDASPGMAAAALPSVLLILA